MLLTRVNEAYATGTYAVGSTVDCELDGSLADEPHLRVSVMMWRMRKSIWRQGRLMRFDVLAGCESSFNDLPYLCVV